MAGEPEQFKHTLVRMLQSGVLQKFLGCEEGQAAAVEFHLGYIYQVQLNRHTIVVEEVETEEVRRKTQGDWVPVAPVSAHRNRIILERRTGKILRSPRWGVLKPARRVRQERKAHSATLVSLMSDGAISSKGREVARIA